MKRIVIITGASSGMGREFALQLARTRTADEIWLLVRRKDKLQEVSLALAEDFAARQRGASKEGVFPGKPVPRVIEIDLGGNEGLDTFNSLLKKEQVSCRDEGFIVDTLVNNAGFGTYGTFAETDIDRQLAMIDLNVYTLTGLCYSVLPYLSKGSLIINVASLASFIPLGNFAVYGATKSYVLSFSTAFAAEIADAGIQVTTVCPGPVDTEFANVASNGARKKVVDGKSPAKVVAHCLAQVEKGKHFAIMAPKWKFKAFMSRFVGRYAYARHSYIHEKRPSKPTKP
jgi:short-subunit dehydrogenase